MEKKYWILLLLFTILGFALGVFVGLLQSEKLYNELVADHQKTLKTLNESRAKALALEESLTALGNTGENTDGTMPYLDISKNEPIPALPLTMNPDKISETPGEILSPSESKESGTFSKREPIQKIERPDADVIRELITKRSDEYDEIVLDAVLVNENEATEIVGDFIVLVSANWKNLESEEVVNPILQKYAEDLVSGFQEMGTVNVSEISLFIYDQYKARGIRYKYRFRKDNFELYEKTE